MRDERILDDLSDEELEDYETNPEKYEEVTENTNDFYRGIMYPDGEDD